MAGPRLEPDPAAKDSLSRPESRIQLEMPEQVGDGGTLTFLGATAQGMVGRLRRVRRLIGLAAFPEQAATLFFSVSLLP